MENLPQERTRHQDRIERGVLLSTSGHVISSRPGQWTVRSETDQARTYNVTAHACDCPDSKRGQTICKHQWASAGLFAAFVILALRKATSIVLATRIITPAYQAVADLPEGYLRTLQDEYAQALKRLTNPAIHFKRECSHATCHTTRCGQGQTYGGIAI
jgi:hypothetical protein